MKIHLIRHFYDFLPLYYYFIDKTMSSFAFPSLLLLAWYLIWNVLNYQFVITFHISFLVLSCKIKGWYDIKVYRPSTMAGGYPHVWYAQVGEHSKGSESDNVTRQLERDHLSGSVNNKDLVLRWFSKYNQ